MVALGIVGLVLLITSITPSHHKPDRPSGPTSHPTSRAPEPTAPLTTASPTRTAAAAPAPVTTAEVARLLPLSEAEIARGVEAARLFTAAYSTWRANESTQQYLARLAPLTTAQLRQWLERGAADPATGLQRHSRETSAGQARAEAIRTLGPTSITVIITGTEHTTTPRSSRQEISHYALTVIRGDNGWQVAAVELAATGDSGDTPTGTGSGGTP